MKYLYAKRLVIFFCFLLFTASFALQCQQEDLVLSTLCSYIKEGKNLDLVIELLKNDLPNRPWNQDVRIHLAIAYYKKGEKLLAFKQLKEIAEQVDWMIGFDYATSTSFRQYSRRGKQRRDQVVISRENVGLFYFTYGLLLKLNGEIIQAERRFKTAIRAGYDETDTRFQLLDLYLETKRYMAAKNEFNSIAKFLQEDEKIIFLKGFFYYKDKKLKEAQSCFEKALSLKSDFLLAKKNLALLQYNTGNYQEAIKILQEIIQSHPDDKDAHINLGRAYFHNGEIEKAKEEFRTAGLAIAVEKYSPKRVPLSPLQLTRDVEFKLSCGK